MLRLLTPLATAVLAIALIIGRPLDAASPPSGGTIAIEPRTADGEYDPAMPAFVDAAAAALTARGFTILDDPAHSAWSLELVLSRSDVGTALAKVPGQSSPLVGPGIIVPLSTGKSDVVPLRRTRLEMRVRRRGGDAVVWHGAAVTVRTATARRDADASAATDLSRAILQSYPAEPQGVVGVP